MPKQSTLFSLRHREPMPTVEKLFPSGAYEVSDIINGQLIRRRYFGYTKAEAIAQFQQDTQPKTLDISPL